MVSDILVAVMGILVVAAFVFVMWMERGGSESENNGGKKDRS